MGDVTGDVVYVMGDRIRILAGMYGGRNATVIEHDTDTDTLTIGLWYDPNESNGIVMIAAYAACRIAN